MSVTVEPFPNLEDSKKQALKPLEEAAEVFGAWQEYDRFHHDAWFGMIAANEIADCIQALFNLAHAMGIDDMQPYMDACHKRNEERGRY